MAGEDADKDVAEENTIDSPDPTEAVDAAQAADSAETAGAEPVPAEEVESMISEAVAEALAQQQDSVLRAQAEVQNMRRRCEQDVEKAHKFALEKFGGDLLSVMDNLERALQAVTDMDNEQVKSLYEGVELTMKGFLDALNKHSIEQIDPVGEPFDPQQHEAMSMIENDDVEPNSVLTVVQKGYLLNGRVIRPAMVLVAKAGNKQ